MFCMLRRGLPVFLSSGTGQVAVWTSEPAEPEGTTWSSGECLHAWLRGPILLFWLATRLRFSLHSWKADGEVYFGYLGKKSEAWCWLSVGAHRLRTSNRSWTTQLKSRISKDLRWHHQKWFDDHSQDSSRMKYTNASFIVFQCFSKDLNPSPSYPSYFLDISVHKLLAPQTLGSIHSVGTFRSSSNFPSPRLGTVALVLVGGCCAKKLVN